MDYTVLHIAVSDDEQAEILTAELADFPFESFETEDGLLKAYIPAVRLSGCKTDVDALLAVHGENALRQVILHGLDAGDAQHVVRVQRVAGRTGLDMGSGTGVLAIVAAKCGAAHVDAVDIDDWADENCRENVAANGVADRVEPMLGDVGRIAGRRYDFILANINRNVLVADMPAYAAALVPGGDLVMSGFLEADTAAVTQAAAEQGMETVAAETREGWMMIRVKKKK